MELLHYLRNAVANLFKRRRMNDDLEEELKHHLAMAERSNLEAGMSPTEARRAARVEFGGVEKLSEECRDSWGMRIFENLMRDLRLAGRQMANHRRFSAVVVLTLALAIGVNTSIFTVITGILFNPLPTPNGDQVVAVGSPHRPKKVSYPDYVDLREQNRAFAALEANKIEGVVCSVDGGRPITYKTGFATPGLLGMLQTHPILGRGFSEQDDESGAEPVVILGYRTWRNDFAEDPDVIGKSLRVNGRLATVIGVLPQSFVHPMVPEMWMPLVPEASTGGKDRRQRDLNVWGILRQGANLAQANAELAVIAQRIAEQHGENEGIGFIVQPFADRYIQRANLYGAYVLMFATVGLVLLIACATVANLMLGRAIERRFEMATRAAIGATRGQIIRQLLTESVSLSMIGGVFGLLISVSILGWLEKFGPATIRPYFYLFSADLGVFAFVATISLACGILFGIAPAIRATRTNLVAALNDNARFSESRKSARLAAALVVGQFALTVLLMTGAGLTINSVLKIGAANGFVPENEIMLAHAELPSGPGERYAEQDSRVRFYDEILRRLRGVPGVTHAALASSFPGFLGEPSNRIEVEGQAIEERRNAALVNVVSHSPEFFSMIDLPLLRGRNFQPTESVDKDPVAIVSQHFAEAHWPGESAIGKRIRFWNEEPQGWLQVIGVTADLRADLFEENSNSVVFVPFVGRSMVVMIRAPIDVAAKAKAISAIFQEIDPELPLALVQTVGELKDSQKDFFGSISSILLIFAAIGMLISSIGVYAVVAQATARRTKEIGIRKVLGATPFQIQMQMAKRGVKQLSVGLALGLLLAVAGAQLLTRQIRFLTADPSIFVSVALVLIGVGLFACWLPARKASLAEPSETLRFG